METFTTLSTSHFITKTLSSPFSVAIIVVIISYNKLWMILETYEHFYDYILSDCETERPLLSSLKTHLGRSIALPLHTASVSMIKS